MRRAYRPDVARYIAAAAIKRERVEYGDLSGQFGGIAHGYGDKLGGVSIFCKERSLPILPVIVVTKGQAFPAAGAKLYIDLGITNDREMRRAQFDVFNFDWSKVEF